MNKYISLVKNVLIFALGSFGSKLLVFLLVPFYTRVLTPAQYGISDLIANSANLLLPVVSLSIADAVIRFSFDKAVDKKKVFSNGLIVLFRGFGFLLLATPIFLFVPKLSSYTPLIFLYVLSSGFNSVCGQFIRANGQVKLFAWCGFQNTLTVVLLNILSLFVFKLGIIGYVMSIILADFLTGTFIFIIAKLYKYIDFKNSDKALRKSMLAYSIPLIPNALFWWITNVSDRYLVTYMCGETANGLYTVAYKIPTFVTLLSSIFMQAWQLSAISEYDNEHKAAFYSKVFYFYQTLVFVAGSFIILLVKPITHILVSPTYYASWQYVPFLIIAFVFQCFSNFWATIYMAAKKSKVTMFTTFGGALVNIALNLVLIPKYGANGASFATFISYLLVFILRVVLSRGIIKINLNYLLITANLLLITTQTIISLMQIQNYNNYNIAIFMIMILINLNPIVASITQFVKLKK